jgi:hypothetical protein
MIEDVQDYILVTQKQYRTNQLYVFCIIAHFRSLISVLDLVIAYNLLNRLSFFYKESI